MSISPEAAESLLRAIDIIASQKAQQNNGFDQTVICTITDNSCAEKQGYYTVSNGTATFKAYSEITTYKVDQQVRVTIPNGDYGLKKYIAGLYAYSDENSITYVSPLESFLEMETLNFDAEGNQTAKSAGLIANNSKAKEISIWNIDLSNSKYANLQQNNIYDMIGLQASFKCLLNNYKIRSGSYGLRLDLKIKLNSNNLYPITHSLYLDSSRMFGNPYAFSIFSTQAQTYDVSKLGSIIGMDLVFYQSNDFSYQVGKEIAALPIELVENIFVTDVYVALGSNLINVADNTLKLFSSEDLTFKFKSPSDSTNTKNLYFSWCNKDENGKYIGFSDGHAGNVSFDSDKPDNFEPYDEIKYLELTKVHNELMSQMGKNVPNDKTALQAAANISKAEPKLKAVVKLINDDLINTVKAYRDALGTKVSEGIDFDGYLRNLELGAKAISERVEPLVNYVNATLSYSAAVQNGEADQLETPGESNLYSAIHAAINTIGKDEEDGFIKSLEQETYDKISNNYPNYKGIYDSYYERLEKIKVSLQAELEILDSWLSTIEATVKNLPTVGFVPYLEPDYSIYDKRYCAYWYRYEPGYYDTKEPFMESEWKRMDSNYEFNTTAGTMGKIEQNLGVVTSDEDGDGYCDPKNPEGSEGLQIYLNPQATEEKFKVVLFYNHEMFVSNELVFTNLDDISDKTTLEEGTALSIQHGEHSMESYQTLYSSTNSLTNDGNARIDRELKLTYDEKFGGNDALKEAQVYWYVPLNSTMLTFNETKLGTLGFTTDYKATEHNPKYHREGFAYFYKKIGDNEEDLSFYYRVKDYYAAASANNTIYCYVETEDKTMEAEISMVFGTLGTSGTDYTLIVTPAKSTQTAVVSDDPLELQIALYDYNNNKLSLNNLEISWFGPTAYTAEPKEDLYEVKGSGPYGIMKVSITALIGEDNRVVDLSTLYPIAHAAAADYYIEGATSIIYDSAGANPVYYKDPYKLFKQGSSEEIPDLNWTIAYYAKNGEKISSPDIIKYMPTMTSKKTLLPCNIYVANCDSYPVVSCNDNDGNILWMQPIVIIQNRYPSPMLNAWDGSLNIDDDNGTILSTMVGAGRKEPDNSFSGVVMGDVSIANVETGTNALGGNHSGLGLYGFHHGAQSYGFNVDGTAFLGKSSGGRISFDGNHGFIYSQNWIQSFENTNKLPFNYKTDSAGNIVDVNLNTGTDGMAIDLQNGHIDAYNFKLTSGGIRLNATPVEKDDDVNRYYLNVSTKDNKYYIRFNYKGDLELSINDALLPDKNKTLLEYINDQDSYIIENIIGWDPENPPAENVYSYINAIEYLNDENIFNKLTNNGEYEGIFKGGDGKLYINGTYIATGILRSKNWVGKLTYHPISGSPITYNTYDEAKAAVKVGNASWDGQWSLTAAAGTYWNLNNGQLWASDFELNAWKNLIYNSNTNTVSTNAQAGGLYLNSDPGSSGMYLSIGHTAIQTLADGTVIQPHFIQYSGNGSLTMRLNSFILDAWENDSHSGLYLNSNPISSTDYYLSIGDSTGFIQFTKDKKLSLGLKHFVLDAWDNNRDNNNVVIGGIYLNSDPTTGHYFSVGNGNNFIEVSGDGTMRFQTNGEFIINAFNNEEGLYINSQGDTYFQAGNTTNYLKITKTGMDIAINQFILNAFNNSGIYLNSSPDGSDASKIDYYYLWIGNGNHYLKFDKNGNLDLSVKNIYLSDIKKYTTDWYKEQSDWNTAQSAWNITQTESIQATNEALQEAIENFNTKLEGVTSNIPNPEEYFTHERVYAGLTNNGTIPGIFHQKDTNGNVIGLYINATYISTGILRSSNWEGSLIKPDGTIVNLADMSDAALKDIDWNDNYTLVPTKGSYWNLNNGQLFAANFELNAWNKNESQGIYLNSHPNLNNNQYYLQIGDNNSYIRFGEALTIKTSAANLLIGEDDLSAFISAESGTVVAAALDTKLDKNGGTTTNGCSWSLLPSGFSINMVKDSQVTAVMTVNENGLYIDGKIKANEGWIGNWIIGTGGMISNGSTTLTADGKIVATNADIGGKITATSGNIGGCTIADQSISSLSQMPSYLEYISQAQYDFYSNGTVKGYGNASAWHNYAYEILADTTGVKVLGPSGTEYFVVDDIPSGNGTVTVQAHATKSSGETINLTKGKYLIINKPTAGLPFMSTKDFVLSTKAGLVASGATISGDIIADYLKADSGQIGGFKLTSAGLASKYLTINSSNDSSTTVLEIGTEGMGNEKSFTMNINDTVALVSPKPNISPVAYKTYQLPSGATNIGARFAENTVVAIDKDKQTVTVSYTAGSMLETEYTFVGTITYKLVFQNAIRVTGDNKVYIGDYGTDLASILSQLITATKISIS